MRNHFRWLAPPLLAVQLIAAAAHWLVVAWHRRRRLLSDGKEADAMGGEVLMQAVIREQAAWTLFVGRWGAMVAAKRALQFLL